MATKKKPAAKSAKRPTKPPPRSKPKVEVVVDEPQSRPEMRSRPAGEIASAIKLTVQDGIVVVSGDWHCYVGEEDSTAYRALLRFLKGDFTDLPIKACVVNGDIGDFSQIMHHKRIGWEHRAPLVEEIELCQERMHNVQMACPKGTRLAATIGNHDIRYMNFQSEKLPQWEGMPNTTLQELFLSWDFAWRVDVNDDVVIKHSWRGGNYAPYNNAVQSGKTCITGHLHRAQVMGFTDYTNTRWGVDHGLLAATTSRAFVNYTQSSPLGWRSGFAAVSFRKGQLLMPELVTVVDEDKGIVNWRGTLIRV